MKPHISDEQLQDVRKVFPTTPEVIGSQTTNVSLTAWALHDLEIARADAARMRAAIEHFTGLTREGESRNGFMFWRVRPDEVRALAASLYPEEDE